MLACLTKLQQEESKAKQECIKFMGSTRLALQDALKNKLGVHRADYHSSCFVGNHCDLIVDKYEVLTAVIDVKEKYDKFFEHYKLLDESQPFSD